MRRVFQPSVSVPTIIIASVIAMVVIANVQDGRRRRDAYTAAPPIGTSGAPSTSRESIDERIKLMEARLQKRPDDAGAAVLLADALLRQTRVTGNPGLAFRAEQVLRQTLADDPSNYDTNRMLGALYLSQHRFKEAIAVGERNRETRPYDPVNDGVIGDGHLELGEYDEAFDAFDRMMRLRPSAGAYARVAYARELQGNLNGAIDAMMLAADATSPEDPEALAWTHAQIGDLYQQAGRLYEAKQQYSTASRVFPGHPFAVVGYARAIAAEGDLSGALTLLQDLARKSPTPDLAARIGDLLDRLDRHAEAERQYALAEAGWRVDAPEPKNLARFLAEHNRHLDRAVAIAEAAAAERHDIFTEDALAWAYYKAGRVGDAKKAIALAIRTGTRDRDIRAHAAAIESAAPQVASR
jgi:tetratricopeptide (TPR) repeat protein